MFATPIQKLIDAFIRLPGVGPKTAERFALYLLKSGRGETARLQKALEELLQSVRTCETCQNFSDTSPCAICAHGARAHDRICVVAEPQDIRALEKTGAYTGVYHVLRGYIQPLDGMSDDRLKINELLARVRDARPTSLTEIIFAFDPTIEGEATIQYLTKLLEPFGVPLTRLATGLPSGGSVEYADEITLERALAARQHVGHTPI